jgi:hypothetical protein
MTRPKSEQGGPPGRRSKREEVDLYLQSLELDPEVLRAIRAADPRAMPVPTGAPGSFADMRDRAVAMIWKKFEKGERISTAETRTLKEIIDLAKSEPDGGAEVDPEPLIADFVAGVVALAPGRRRQILLVEESRLRRELDAITEAIGLLPIAEVQAA